MRLVQPPVPDATSKTERGELAGSAAFKPESESEGVDSSSSNGFQDNTIKGRGEGNEGRWVMVDDFFQGSDKTSLVWADMRQELGTDGEKEYGNFWPGTSRWILAAKLDNGVIELGAGKTWPTPRSVL